MVRKAILVWEERIPVLALGGTVLSAVLSTGHLEQISPLRESQLIPLGPAVPTCCVRCLFVPSHFPAKEYLWGRWLDTLPQCLNALPIIPWAQFWNWTSLFSPNHNTQTQTQFLAPWRGWSCPHPLGLIYYLVSSMVVGGCFQQPSRSGRKSLSPSFISAYLKVGTVGFQTKAALTSLTCNFTCWWTAT